MSLYPSAPAPSLKLRPLGAIAVSLATVMAFTTLLGFVFLPHEIEQLADRVPVSILDHYPLANGRRAILLTRWNEAGRNGGFLWEVALSDAALSDSESAGPYRVLVPASADPLITTASGSGDRLLVGRTNGQILVVDLEATDLSPSLVGRYLGGGLNDLRCSDSGEVMVAGGASGLCAWNTKGAWNTKERPLCWSRNDLQLVRWVIDSTSNRLLVDSADGELLELDLGTGQTLRVIGTFGRAAIAMALTRDGTRIARIAYNSCLEMIDRASGETVWSDSQPPRQWSYVPRALAFSPCGSVLVTAAVADPCCPLVWNVATGRPLGELRAHETPIAGLAFAPDGRLYSWGVDGTVVTWNSPADHPSGSARLVEKIEADGLKLASRRVPLSRMAPAAISLHRRY